MIENEDRGNPAHSSVEDISVKLLLTLAEAQRLTGLGRTALMNAHRAGDLRLIYIGRGYKVRPSDLQAFMKERGGARRRKGVRKPVHESRVSTTPESTTVNSVREETPALPPSVEESGHPASDWDPGAYGGGGGELY